MTPEEVFVQAMENAHRPKAAGLAKTASPCEELAVSDEARRLFLAGMQRVALAEQPLQPIQTSPRSPWYRKRCAECRHTFRVGDPVATCPRCGRFYHWHPLQNLDCLGVVSDNEDGQCICRSQAVPELPKIEMRPFDPLQMSAFLGGIAEEWNVFGDWRPTIAGPEVEGRLCVVCGHTLRQGEMIVPCPCGNGPGGSCPAWIHLDFARQLHCWNDWNGGRGKNYCPLTGHKNQSRTGS